MVKQFVLPLGVLVVLCGLVACGQQVTVLPTTAPPTAVAAATAPPTVVAATPAPPTMLPTAELPTIAPTEPPTTAPPEATTTADGIRTGRTPEGYQQLGDPGALVSLVMYSDFL